MPTVNIFASFPKSGRSRSFISRDALFVNVTAPMLYGLTFLLRTRCAMRFVITLVLPLPGPATIRTGPSTDSTDSRCAGLSCSRKLVVIVCVETIAH